MLPARGSMAAALQRINVAAQRYRMLATFRISGARRPGALDEGMLLCGTRTPLRDDHANQPPAKRCRTDARRMVAQAAGQVPRSCTGCLCDHARPHAWHRVAATVER